MGAREIEIWAHQVIDRLKNNQQIKDSVVELKSVWLDPPRAARRIAGHANAARGQPILWLIGVDEGTRTVVGAPPMDLANWFPQVSAYFDELVPDLTDVAVAVDGTTVVALRFATDRAPYITKHGQGEVTREVPWREGTRVRSASRSEILQIFASVPQLPAFDIVSAQVEVFPQKEGGLAHTGEVELEVYAQPQTRERFVLPVTNVTLTFQLLDWPGAAPLPCKIWWFGTQHPRWQTRSEIAQAARLAAATIHTRERDLVIDGPGSIYILGEFDHVLFPQGYEKAAMKIEFTLAHPSLPRPIELQADVAPGPFIAPGDIEASYWRLPQHNSR